jgi:hypothetical protein
LADQVGIEKGLRGELRYLVGRNKKIRSKKKAAPWGAAFYSPR